MIVATAGHVDHGKTELVKALTGIDTDRLPEEKVRGLTIDLGFAYHKLDNGQLLGFVDVPGHQKFIRNMLAGVAGIDLSLLVVAADDGIMPQTREHLEILSLLGVPQLLVVITKIDRVSWDRVAGLRVQIRKLLKKSGYKKEYFFPTCAPKGIGLLELKQELMLRAEKVASRKSDGKFRMAIDRVFTVNGVGLVVTGMVLSGTVLVNDKLTLSSQGSIVRVRGLRAYDQRRDKVKAGERCAINIAGRGVGEHSIKRGAWLTHPDLNVPTNRLDVQLKLLEAGTGSLKNGAQLNLHIGSDHLPTRVALLSDGKITASQTSYAQLVLARQISVLHGDHFVLRDPAARRTIGGGRVIDPFAPKRGRNSSTRLAELEAMAGKSTKDILGSLAKQSVTGVQVKIFSIAHNISVPQIHQHTASLGLRLVGHFPEQRVFCETRWQTFLDNIITCVRNFHKMKPGKCGASVEDLQKLLKISIEKDLIAYALNFMVSETRLTAYGHRFCLPSHMIDLSEHDKALLASAAIVLAPDFGAPPGLAEAAREIGTQVETLEKALKIGVKLGQIVCIKKNRYVNEKSLAEMKKIALRVASESSDGLITIKRYRCEVNMGRNFVVALFEYFDRICFTERMGDYRRIRGSQPKHQEMRDKK